jgi:large subunit ribosomal protein L32e
MTKKDVIKQFTKLKGIGESKAQALYEKGFTTIEKLQQAKTEDLTSIKGITEKIANDIITQLQTTPQKTEKPKQPTKQAKPTEKKQPTKKEEKEEPTPEKTEPPKEETEETYQVKQKPKITKEQKNLIKKRQEIKQRTPKFLREEWFRYKRIPRNWRRPDGLTSKMRQNLKYRPSKVRVGFRGPKKTRHLHPSGFEEIIIHTTDELDHINPETQAIRIGGTVGTKKRLEILKKATKKEIRILNMKG